MDDFKIQALISQEKAVTLSEIDPINSYLQIGVYQKGNQKRRSGNFNVYPSFAIPIEELLGYNLIQDEGFDLVKRRVIDFKGTGVTAVDDPINKKTVVNITSGTGTVTSVGLSMPPAFNVANSPVTTANTLAVTGAGLNSQYIRGDGTLANFPEFGGGGASTSYYLNGGTNQGTFGGVTYYEMNSNAVVGSAVNFSITADDYIAQFITDPMDPNQLTIPGGNWDIKLFLSTSSAGGNPQYYVELYKYDGAVFTLIATDAVNPEGITGGTATDLYITSLAVPTTTLALTDRLALRIFVIHSGRTITLHTQDGTLCQIVTTFSTGLTALNGLTAQIQTFANDESGTDFAINSTGSVHTFSLPTASAVDTGKLTNADWTTFNSKLDDTGWIDYSGISTIVGWGSFTNKELRYRVIGKQVFVHYFIFGTSNSTTTSFTVPFLNDIYNVDILSRGRNNGVNRIAFGYMAPSSNVANFYYWVNATSNTNVWTASGSKFIIGHFFYTLP